MSEKEQGFGRRGLKTQTSAAPVKSYNVIYRAGADARWSLHGSHIEVHWPKYGAVAAAIFALVHLILDGKRDPFGLLLVPVLVGGLSYLAMNGLRRSLNNVHTLRTQLFRSPAFLIGAMIGLAYFLYSTFVVPQTVMGVEWGAQIAFDDGFQRQDLAPFAMLVFKAAGLMVLGGMVLEVVARRVLGAEKEAGSKL